MTAGSLPTPISTPLDFDPMCLDAFLRKVLGGLAGHMTLERIAGGQSNPTFFLNYENRSLVLRKQPPLEILPSAHAVDREYRILTVVFLASDASAFVTGHVLVVDGGQSA